VLQSRFSASFSCQLAERKSRLYLALPIVNKTAQNANDAINNYDQAIALDPDDAIFSGKRGFAYAFSSVIIATINRIKFCFQFVKRHFF
jgi:hypothetical protein